MPGEARGLVSGRLHSRALELVPGVVAGGSLWWMRGSFAAPREVACEDGGDGLPDLDGTPAQGKSPGVWTTVRLPMSPGLCLRVGSLQQDCLIWKTNLDLSRQG